MTSATTSSPNLGLFRWTWHVEAALDALASKRFLPALILMVGLLPSAWMLYVLRDAPQLGLAGDDVMFIGAARSLADHGTYRESALPGDPWQTKYPPGYPLMLAAILKWNPANLSFWIIAHSWAWLAAGTVALAWAMRHAGLTPVQAAFVGALWAANPWGANAGVLALSDAPYCAVLFISIGLTLRLPRGSSPKAALAGTVLGLSCIIRTAGIVALCGIMVWLIWRKGPKIAAWFGFSAAVLPAIWLLWSRAHLPSGHGPIYEFYFSYLGRWAETIRQAGIGRILIMNFRFAVKSIADWLVPFEISGFPQLVGYLVLLTFACVSLDQWGGGAVTASALSTVAFQLAWNWPPNGRFFLPVAPAFLGAAVATLRAQRAIVCALALLTVFSLDCYDIAELSSRYRAERHNQLEPAYLFVKAHLPVDAIILGEDRIWLFTGRKSVGLPAPLEYYYLSRPDMQTKFFFGYKEIARQVGAGYVLFESSARIRWDVPSDQESNLVAAINSDPDLERVFYQSGVELFRIHWHGPGLP